MGVIDGGQDAYINTTINGIGERAGNADLVAYFADRMDMYSYYGPSPVVGTFGDCLLSRFPIENARTFYLFSKGEQVAVVEADIRVGDKTFRIYVTHLGNGGQQAAHPGQTKPEGKPSTYSQTDGQEGQNYGSDFRHLLHNCG